MPKALEGTNPISMPKIMLPYYQHITHKHEQKRKEFISIKIDFLEKSSDFEGCHWDFNTGV